MSQTKEEDGYSEDATPSALFSSLNITGLSAGGLKRQSDEIVYVTLPCGHKMPQDYLTAWCRYGLTQNKTSFTCPTFDEVRKKTCGSEFSYHVLCQKVTLAPKVKEHFEERLGALTAAKLCQYKSCPGCQSFVERADKKNLCVRCTICTARMGCTYEFCWNCRQQWKGPAISDLKCGNSGCGKQEVSPPNPLVLCRPEFKREKLQELKDDVYLMTDKSPARKRLALLINNIEFGYVDDRVGAEKDELSMEKLFEGLGYTVVTLRNLSASGMKAAMQDFSQREEHKQSDSCFVVFMSHGNAFGLSGYFDQGNDEDVFPTNDIFEQLNTPHCAGLRDKPKSSSSSHAEGEVGEVPVEDGGNRGPKTEHREKDFCCLRSCTPDTVSYRNKMSGSAFIQDIVEIFNQHAHQDHIEELFRKVLKKFKEKHPCQMPCKERTTLSKKFYLFPGL